MHFLKKFKNGPIQPPPLPPPIRDKSKKHSIKFKVNYFMA